MKNNMLKVSSLLVVVAMLLTACSAPSALVSSQVNSLLTDLQNQVVEKSEDSVASNQSASPSSDVNVQSGSEVVAAYEEMLQNVYEQVNDSVVNIQVLVEAGANNFGFEMPSIPGAPFDPNTPENPQQNPPYGQGLGSGFIWDKEGHIVTNNHVVDNAVEIEVVFSDGTTVPAELVGADPDSDLAVLKVDVPADKLIPVQVADSTQVKVGQVAIAIGNPFGLEGTMTEGIVSALGRTLPAGQGTGTTYSIPDIIQTDAPINPGNSGGVLVNSQGQLIGVTAAIESTVGANAGIGFVIPSAIVSKVVPALIADGHYAHPYLGILGATLTPDLATAMDLESDQRGALVIEVVEGGPADQAGLQGSNKSVTIDGQEVNVGGDLIIAVDGQPVKDMEDIIAYLSRNTGVGQKITLTILRDGEAEQVEVTLEARPKPAQQEAQTQLPSPEAAGTAYLGIYGTTLVPEIAKAMGLPEDQKGVLVSEVTPGDPADKAGLKGGTESVDVNGQQVQIGGDVITAFGGNPVSDIEGLRSMIQATDPGSEVALSLLRDGNPIEVLVTLGTK